jgi:hypothetical protein
VGVALVYSSGLWPLDEIDRSTLVVAMCDVMMLSVAWSEDHGIACGAMRTRGEHHGEYPPS